jgi:C4-dicarboxylate transporter DctQ subunit
MNRLFRALKDFEGALAGTLLLASLAIVILEISSRQILGSSFLWSEEMSRYAMIWMAYFGMVAAVEDDSHIRVDFLRDRLPLVVRRWLECFGLLGCLVFSGYVFWYGLRLVSDSRMLGIVSADSNIGVPIWVFQSIIPIAFGLLCLRLGIRLAQTLVPATRQPA